MNHILLNYNNDNHEKHEGTPYATGNNIAFRNKRAEMMIKVRRETGIKFSIAKKYGFVKDRFGNWKNTEYNKTILKQVYDKSNRVGLMNKIEQLLGKVRMSKYEQNDININQIGGK